MAVDFTRTAKSVTDRGVDPNIILERDQIKTDLRALLAQREKPVPFPEAIQLMHDLNDELVEPPLTGHDDEATEDLEYEDYFPDFSEGSPSPSLQQFVYLEKNWAPVDSRWFGHFFNKDSFIVIARYWVCSPIPPPPKQRFNILI